jgi:hypothetical protein
MVCGLAAVLTYVTRQEAVSEAVPLAGWAAHPEMVAPPSKNSSLPVGSPAPGDLALTIAVSVTDRPATEGFGEEVTTVAVGSWLTT